MIAPVKGKPFTFGKARNVRGATKRATVNTSAEMLSATRTRARPRKPKVNKPTPYNHARTSDTGGQWFAYLGVCDEGVELACSRMLVHLAVGEHQQGRETLPQQDVRGGGSRHSVGKCRARQYSLDTASGRRLISKRAWETKSISTKLPLKE